MIFCTLSDKNYLLNGIALYENLVNMCDEDFLLYYLCVDEETYNFLNNQNFKNVIPVSLSTLENNQFYQQLKNNHKSNPIDTSNGQSHFHWALAPFFTQLVLLTLNDEIMYIDSDIYFYKDPKCIFETCKDYDVGLITHKHVKLEKNKRNVGYYNVGIIYFKNSTFGSACCRWWKDVVIDTSNPWYNPFGSCGDQKYLEIFQDIFPFIKIKIIDEDIGHSAPWNMGPSKLENMKYTWESHFVIPNTKHTTQDLVFHHFSHFTPNFNNNTWNHQRQREWGNCVDTKEKIKLHQDYFNTLKNIKERYQI